MSLNQPESDPGPVLGRWDLLPLLGAASLLGLCQTLWNRLPDPLPTHFGPDGQPNDWTPKALAPWFMFGLPFVIWVLLALVGTWSAPSDPERSALQRRCMAPMRGLTVLGFLVLMSLMVLIPVHGLTVFWPTLGVFLALLFLGLGLTARLGYFHASEEVRRLWKWGMFYVNPQDPTMGSQASWPRLDPQLRPTGSLVRHGTALPAAHSHLGHPSADGALESIPQALKPPHATPSPSRLRCFAGNP